jgi:choline dehydrogenase-like flavoprotein
MEPKKIFDVVILGCGPAGIQAAIHASRKKASVLLLGRLNKSSLFWAHVKTSWACSRPAERQCSQPGWRRPKVSGGDAGRGCPAHQPDGRCLEIETESEMCSAQELWSSPRAPRATAWGFPAKRSFSAAGCPIAWIAMAASSGARTWPWSAGKAPRPAGAHLAFHGQKRAPRGGVP